MVIKGKMGGVYVPSVAGAPRCRPETARSSGALARTLRVAWLGAGLLGVLACSSSPKRPDSAELAPAPPPAQYRNRFGDDVPVVLVHAMADAYALPAPDCVSLVLEVQALDDALGADLDVRDGGPAPEKLLVVALSGAVKGLVPYYSWLRRLSGEHGRFRHGVAAIAAGSVRRAYLKGLGEARACPLPAAPKRTGVVIQEGIAAGPNLP